MDNSDLVAVNQIERPIGPGSIVKLKSGGPPVPLIIARLGVSGTLAAGVRDSFRESGANGVTRTLQETAAAILPHAQDTAQLVTPA